MAAFNYIILGGGSAGLQLAVALTEDPYFSDKQILLIEKEQKTENDRTWCFWEAAADNFENTVAKTWPKLGFKSQGFSQNFDIAPYAYKMIRSREFYTAMYGKLEKAANCKVLQAEVERIVESAEYATVHTSVGSYQARQVFSSIYKPELPKQQQRYPVLQQHFLGWFVQTEKPVFDSNTALFMDFSIPQKGNTRFMYVLPSSPNKALIEYTLFSEDLLEDAEYERAIERYLTEDLDSSSYSILEKEKGIIPMTNYDFAVQNSPHIFYIGTAGGWSKPSTGFTFMNTRKKVAELVRLLKKGESPQKLNRKTRYWYYDLLLLDILSRDNSLGSRIFESLFRRRSPQLVLKFLDEETNLWEDLMVITACPALPFMQALWRRLWS